MKKILALPKLKQVGVIVLLVLVATWLMSAGASAGASAQQGPACGGVSVDNIVLSEAAGDANWGDLFVDMIYAIVGAGQCMSGVFISDGAQLAVVLCGISFMLFFLIYMVEPASPRNVSNIVLLVIKAGLVMAMLGAWSGGMRQGSVPDWLPENKMGDVTVESALVKPFDDMANGLFTKYSSWTGRTAGKSAVWNALASSWKDMWNANQIRGRIRDEVRNKIENPLTWLRSWLESIGDSIVTLIVAAIVFILIGLLMVSYVFVLYFGDVAVIIGMVCGPLMIPGLLFQPLRFLFDSWLKFMISAGFYKIIAAVVALLTLTSVSYVQAIANKMYAKWSAVSPSATAAAIDSGAMVLGYYLSMIMTVLFLLFGLFLMWQVGKLTSALMSGQGGEAAAVAQQAGVQSISTVSMGMRGVGGGIPGVPGTTGSGNVGMVTNAIGGGMRHVGANTGLYQPSKK